MILRRFYGGLNPWEKCFLDSLSNGRLVTGNPVQANIVMKNLFGNSRKTKKELEIHQLRGYLEETISNLQKSNKEIPNKNDVNRILLHMRTKLNTFPNSLNTLVRKMKSIEYHVKTKDYFIENVHSKITLISHLLGHARDLVTSVKSEEENYKIRKIEDIIEEETTMRVDKKESQRITNDKKV
jgi:hypothetical protein